MELPVGVGLAVLLVAIALYYGWRQLQSIRAMSRDVNVTFEERMYLVRQAIRRISISVLLLIIASFLVTWFFLDHSGMPPEDFAQGDRPMTNSEKDAVRFVGLYWISALLVVFVIIVLAVFDLWATARFGYERRKRLEEARQAALAAELAQLRQRRAELN